MHSIPFNASALALIAVFALMPIVAEHDHKKQKTSAGRDEIPTPTPRDDTGAKGRNATYLASKYPMKGDEFVVFEEETHKYTVHGQVVKRSCTGAKDDLFPKMDTMLTIRKYYFSWKRNPAHKLHSLIWETLNDSDKTASDANAMEQIASTWSQMGTEASTLGTLLHLYIELHYNECAMSPIPSEIEHEVRLFHQFVASPFYVEKQLQMVRTELTVFEYRDGIPVCAGQIDGLMKDVHGNHYIFDWKRSKHVLKPYERAFKNEMGTHPLTAHIPNTHFHKYSLQLSLYAEMIVGCHGIDVANRLYLVRMHPDLDTFELTHCEDYRSVARQILNMMFEELR